MRRERGVPETRGLARANRLEGVRAGPGGYGRGVAVSRTRPVRRAGNRRRGTTSAHAARESHRLPDDGAWGRAANGE